MCSRKTQSIHTSKSLCFACGFVFVCCDLPRNQTCWSSLQLSLHLNLHGSLQTLLRPNLLVREIHRDQCNRSRSSSRSTQCHRATLVAVDELDYEHCRDRTYSFVLAIVVFIRDHPRDRRLVAIGVLACDSHRDQQNVVKRPSSPLTSSFASIVVIDVLDRVRDRRTRSRSPSRSTNVVVRLSSPLTRSFAIVVAIGSTRSCSRSKHSLAILIAIELRPASSRQDSEVVGCVASRRASDHRRRPS